MRSCSRSMRAASRMNSTETSRVLRLSRQSRISSTGTPRMLASQIPMMVTVSSPDSGCTKLDRVYTRNTVLSEARLCRYSGIQRWRSASPRAYPPPTPSAMPMMSMCMKFAAVGARPPFSPATISSKTSTASNAPSGSMMIPSQRRIRPTCAVGRTVRSIGTITVGPVTTMMAPNSIATRQSKPIRKWLAVPTITQVTSMPTDTRLRTTRSRPRISSKRRVMAPSYRMKATESDTRGYRSSPSRASGSSIPRPGPSARPPSRRMRMAGSLMRQATHCERIATMPIRVMLTTGSFMAKAPGLRGCACCYNSGPGRKPLRLSASYSNQAIRR